jgi:hypothetical protein
MPKRIQHSQVTEQTSFAGLRQQAERLEIPDYAKMRKADLAKAVNHHQTQAKQEGIDATP